MSFQTFQVHPFDLAMMDEAQLISFWERATQYFHGSADSVRIIGITEPFPSDKVQERIAKQISEETVDWRRAGLIEYSQFIDDVMRLQKLQTVSYYLCTWSKAPPEANVAVARQLFGTPVDVAELPPMLNGQYKESLRYLEPETSGAPYAASLTSYQLTGDWDFNSPIAELLSLPYEVAVSIDVETFTRVKALSSLDIAYNALEAQLTKNAQTRDAKSQRAFNDVQQTQHYVGSGGSLHTLSVTVLIKAATPELLTQYITEIQQMVGSKMKLRLCVGQQATAIGYFTAKSRQQVGLAISPHNITGQGVAALLPFGFRRTTDANGIFIGLDRRSSAPVFRDGWGDINNKKANHAIILGMTGGGKTFSTFALLLREALRGTQIICLEPLGHSERLASAAGQGGTFNNLDFNTTNKHHVRINIMDIAHNDLPSQINHVIMLLGILLERDFSNQERSIFTAALQRIYENLDFSRVTLRNTPRLEALCQQLEIIGVDLAMFLSNEIRGLYVDGINSLFFNAASNIQLDLGRLDVIAFSFAGVPDNFKTLVYTVIFTRLNNMIENINDNRRRIIFVDEYWRLASGPAILQQAVVNAFKTWRTKWAACWASDQQPLTFADSDAGRYMAENAAWTLLLKQESQTGRDKLAELWGDLSDNQLRILSSPEAGEGILRTDGRLHHIKIQASPRELYEFSGT